MGHQALLIPRLILITDRSRIEGERFFEVVDAALAGGVDAALVREKDMTSAKLLSFCARIRTLTNKHHAKLIVHSQADVAKAVGADGVHVAAAAIDEIPLIRQWLNDSNILLSASCHNEEELAAASSHGADFALLSPVFPTGSHPGAPHLGANRFHEIAKHSPMPVIGLGGISVENRSEIADFGAAVIGAILDASDPEAAARLLSASSR